MPVNFLHQLIQSGESLQQLFQRGVSSSLETFITTQREAGKLWKEVAMRGWIPPAWKPDRAQTTSAEPTEQTAEALLKAELELLKESLERLERKITDTENKPAGTP